MRLERRLNLRLRLRKPRKLAAVRGIRSQRQGDGEGAPGAGLVLDPDLTAEVVIDLPREGEAQPRAVGAGGALSAVEAVEDVRYLGLGYAAAMVGDADNGAAILAGEAEVHGGSG